MCKLKAQQLIHLKFRALRKKRIVLKLALQRLEISTSQRITDSIREFELLLWWVTGYGCWRWAADERESVDEESSVGAARRRHRS
ncbi:MAG: hypothetical protein V7K77_28475 [Nostoc sp.]|uniref:hypothetical protein n=1 Tax=Nostoc sp. TaxID=1180 RepID=UPI002FF8C675